MGKCYVYVIFRPNGMPCYVGKGTGNRMASHASGTHNRQLARIFAEASGRLPMLKVREGLTAEQAWEIESAFIAAIGRQAHGGPLVNQTDGGDGRRGQPHTEEWKRAMSAKITGMKRSPETCKKIGDAHRGLRATNETRATLSAVHMGKTHSMETRQKMAASNRGQTRSEDFRAKCRQRKGWKHTAESKEKMRQAKLMGANHA